MGNAQVDREKKVAATAQYADSLNQDQPAPSSTSEPYAKLIAMLNKHDLKTSTST